jgi:hypothetical protein
MYDAWLSWQHFSGFMILIFLVTLVIVIIVRIKQNKHPIPSRHEMRTMAGNVRNRLTMRNANRNTDNDLYESKETSATYHVSASSSKVRDTYLYLLTT